MARERYNRRVKDDEFTQRVRRHSPSSLLPLIAAAGARYPRPADWWASPYRIVTPWALAEIARVALLYGNEHRSVATEHDLIECLAAYASMDDPELGQSDQPEALANFFLRIAGQQLTYQQDVHNELARTVALYAMTESSRTTKVITPGWDVDLLGCSLREFTAAGLLLNVGAMQNEGRFDVGWLAQPQFAPIVAEVPASTLEGAIRGQFLTDPADFAIRQQQLTGTVTGQGRRFSYNPLVARPLIGGLAHTELIPVPYLAIRHASPLGIYYEGLARWGKGFADDTGYLYESYVGRLLRLLPGGEVHAAITFDRDNKESVDWIVVFNGCVVLVEVKSVRPTEPVRLGTSSAVAEMQRMLSKGLDQLARTASLIRERHASFTEIPDDRPILGVLATLEPFHVVNAPWYTQWLPYPGIPYSICGAFELDHLAEVTDEDPGELLLRGMTDPQRIGYSLKSMFEGHRLERHQVLSAAWETLPWKEAASDA
ncbi:MAG TPA: hypothetical protein VHB69_15425 [Mycobacteriales bacterium]|nr:hypothetical protein [Mycobacteriales bacterium]